jgi:hypothetical protein
MSDYGYTDRFLDITAPMGQVEIEVKDDGSVVWVHTDGRTVLRLCRITDRVILNDHRPDERLIEDACKVMHDAYEKAALGAGWETNPASRKPWADVPEANKETMRAAVIALLGWLDE